MKVAHFAIRQNQGGQPATTEGGATLGGINTDPAAPVISINEGGLRVAFKNCLPRDEKCTSGQR